MSESRMNKSIEEENLYGDSPFLEGEITEPFDPKDVDIVSQPMIVANIIERLKRNTEMRRIISETISLC